ncbi:MAG: hypothetical protein KF883_12485 [Thermomicrobiales bacterium]|nr:hypothetical protein [Thermomicrobiales bacterium]
MNDDLPELDFRDDQASDPGFDLRRGLIVLVTAITLMVIVTLICVWLAEP